jgi:trigger factor
MISVEDRAAKKGDTAVIDFEGFTDGKAFDGGKAEGHSLELGSGQFIPGFEDQIVGKSVGDEFDVVVTFPENYQMEDFAGKEATFKCKLNGITVEELPEADDEFIQDSTEFESLDAFKENARQELEKNAQRDADVAFDNAIMEALIKMVDVPIPNVMFEHRLDTIVSNFEEMLKEQGMSIDLYLQYTGVDMEDFRDTNRDRAENEVKLRLALEKISELENIEISAEELNNSLQPIADAYHINVEEVKRRIPIADYLMDMRVSKALELVKANAEITEPEEAPVDAAADSAEAPAEEKAE